MANKRHSSLRCVPSALLPSSGSQGVRGGGCHGWNLVEYMGTCLPTVGESVPTYSAPVTTSRGLGVILKSHTHPTAYFLTLRTCLGSKASFLSLRTFERGTCVFIPTQQPLPVASFSGVGDPGQGDHLLQGHPLPSPPGMASTQLILA